MGWKWRKRLAVQMSFLCTALCTDQSYTRCNRQGGPNYEAITYTKLWWSWELIHQTEVRRLTQRAFKRWMDLSDTIHYEYKMMRNTYTTMIKIEKKRHWEVFLQKMDERTVWMAHRYASGEPSDRGRAWVPILKVKQEDSITKDAISNDKKSKAFETFFWGLEHMPITYESIEYPTLKFLYKPITDTQIKWTIGWLSPFKAPEVDRIPNAILFQCADFLIPHLGPLYGATFTLDAYPENGETQ